MFLYGNTNNAPNNRLSKKLVSDWTGTAALN